MDVRRTERPLADTVEGTPEAGFAPEEAVEIAIDDRPAAGEEATASASQDADWRSRLWKSRAVFWNWE
jgi:hypothetical protein